jgi:hypothetical protein
VCFINITNNLEPSEILKVLSIPLLVHLAESANKEVQEQAIWVLGNIAGSGTPFRDEVLDCPSALPTLSKKLRSSSLPVARITSWTVSNLSRGSPPPSWHLVSPLFPTLFSLLSPSGDSEVLSNLLWSLVYFTESHMSLLPPLPATSQSSLFSLLPEGTNTHKVLVVRILGNFFGSDYHVQDFVNLGVIPELKNCLLTGTPMLQKDACWCLSNALAGKHVKGRRRRRVNQLRRKEEEGGGRGVKGGEEEVRKGLQVGGELGHETRKGRSQEGG